MNFPNNFVAGDTTDADLVAENLFSPAATPDSLDQINGQIDKTSFTAAAELNAQAIQPRQVSWARESGATVNLDYISQDWTPKQGGGVIRGVRETDEGYVIPGSSISFMVPYRPNTLLLTWTVTCFFLGSDDSSALGVGPRDQAELVLFIDGQEVPGQIAYVQSQSVVSLARSAAEVARTWTGHHLIPLSNPGQYITADIRCWLPAVPTNVLAPDYPIPFPGEHLRVYCRSMRVIALR